MPGKLSVGDGPQAKPGRELDLRRHRDADERGHSRVGPALAEEGALELGVGSLEGVVVPVEPAARLGGGDEQPEEHGLEERLVLRDPRAGMRARIDGGGRLPLQLLERDRRILAAAQTIGAPFGEGPYERTVLVEGRPSPVLVLHEGNRELAALVELAQQEREGTERKGPQGMVQLG